MARSLSNFPQALCEMRPQRFSAPPSRHPRAFESHNALPTASQGGSRSCLTLSLSVRFAGHVSSELDPDGEFFKLEETLAQLGARLGAQYDSQRHLLSANHLCVSLTLNLGQQLGGHVEVTTDPNLGQRMADVPRVTPHIADFTLVSASLGHGYRWKKHQIPGETLTTKELAE